MLTISYGDNYIWIESNTFGFISLKSMLRFRQNLEFAGSIRFELFYCNQKSIFLISWVQLLYFIHQFVINDKQFKCFCILEPNWVTHEINFDVYAWGQKMRPGIFVVFLLYLPDIEIVWHYRNGIPFGIPIFSYFYWLNAAQSCGLHAIPCMKHMFSY